MNRVRATVDRAAWAERFRTNAILWTLVLLFGGVGVILACWVGLLIVLGLYTWTWPSTTGQVTDSAITIIDLEDSEHNYYPNIQYSYEVRGRSYRGNRFALDTVAWSSSSEVEKIIAKYPRGHAVTVYHDRLIPRFSMLRTGLPWAMIIILPILSLCFGGAAYIVWRMFLRKST